MSPSGSTDGASARPHWTSGAGLDPPEAKDGVRAVSALAMIKVEAVTVLNRMNPPAIVASYAVWGRPAQLFVPARSEYEGQLRVSRITLAGILLRSRVSLLVAGSWERREVARHQERVGRAVAGPCQRPRDRARRVSPFGRQATSTACPGGHLQNRLRPRTRFRRRHKPRLR